MAKTNFQEPRMKYNMALEKFEPDLPIKLKHGDPKIKVSWIFILMCIIAIVSLAMLIFSWLK
ncbi:MAG: hypothetical protein OQK82_02900 [Candidatus Pacearchaeota archaeon]|nr:hypothetical protein [Candidatus Pacearchaeota archaeon]